MNKTSILVAATLFAGTALGQSVLAECCRGTPGSSGGTESGSAGTNPYGTNAPEGAGRVLPPGFVWENNMYYGSPYGTMAPEGAGRAVPDNYGATIGSVGPGGTLGGGI
jgi:hypothetical protein